jgi:hypothetical protein
VHRFVTRFAIRRRDETDERGLVLVFCALTIVVVMIFVAYAVDLGALSNERRQDQTAADAGALAGIAVLGAGTDAAALKVIDITYRNLDTGISLGDWTTRWATCSDPDRNTTEYPLLSTQSPCISFNPFLTRIRVRIPNMTVEGSFSRAAGVDHLLSTAVAEAELIYGFSNGILPFGLPNGSGDQTEICLKTGPPSQSPNQPPCDGPTTGNFGSLDISWYGNPLLATPTQCNGNTNGRLAGNMALGVDHPLDEWRGPDEDPPEGSEAIRNDNALCPDAGARPNQILGQTGIGSNLDAGMVSSVSVDGRMVPGRLTRTPFATRIVRSATAVDDTPLWEFIDPALTSGIPPSCVRSGISSKTQMNACLADYAAGVGCATVPCAVPLFTADTDGDVANGVIDIQRSPRFAFVPQLWDDAWGTGSGNYTIKRFRPVFVQTTYFGCNAAGCTGAHDPGETSVGLPLPGNKQLEGLTSLLLTNQMFPAAVIAAGPGHTGTSSIVLRK